MESLVLIVTIGEENIEHKKVKDKALIALISTFSFKLHISLKVFNST
jgi:hypothetical protein